MTHLQRHLDSWFLNICWMMNCHCESVGSQTLHSTQCDGGFSLQEQQCMSYLWFYSACKYKCRPSFRKKEEYAPEKLPYLLFCWTQTHITGSSHPTLLLPTRHAMITTFYIKNTSLTITSSASSPSHLTTDLLKVMTFQTDRYWEDEQTSMWSDTENTGVEKKGWKMLIAIRNEWMPAIHITNSRGEKGVI